MPDYEITIAGRMGPVVGSCLPGLHSVGTPATVLNVLVSNRRVASELLGLLVDHHLTLMDIRIGPVSTGPLANLTHQPSTNQR